MRHFMVILLAATSFGSAGAFAADLPVKAPVHKAQAPSARYDWSGFYLGGHLGYLWGRSHVDENGVEAGHNAAYRRSHRRRARRL